MIRYDKSSGAIALYWWGGLNRHLIFPTLCYAMLLTVIWHARRANFESNNMTVEQEIENTESFGHAISTIVSFTVFLFVFRLNQATTRFNHGSERMVEMFESLEQIVALFCASVEGGPQVMTLSRMLTEGKPKHGLTTDEELWDFHLKCEELARAARVHVVRLTLAFAISFILHTHQKSATIESFGDVSEEGMVYVIYLYSRLRMLLYDDELKAIDDSIIIYAETQEDGERCFRTECGRHQVTGNVDGEVLIGGGVDGNPGGHLPEGQEDGKLICPLHKIIFMILQDLFNQPVDQAWGYTQRQMGPILREAQVAMLQVAHLDQIMACPVSLAYFQHCRVLLIVFALVYPFSCDPLAGVLENVVIPGIGLWAIMGLEKLSDQMENPLGTDDTDINMMEMMHSLEVSCARSWALAENYRVDTRNALLSILSPVLAREANLLETRNAARPKPSFQIYFTWKPMPSLMITMLMEKHGHVDTMHKMFFEGHWSDMSEALRLVLRRVMQPGAEFAEDSEENTKSCATTCCGDDEATLHSLQRDPNIYGHYLVFNHAVQPPEYIKDPNVEGKEEQKFTAWRYRCLRMLGSHHAASLLEVTTELDSERSCLGPALRREPWMQDEEQYEEAACESSPLLPRTVSITKSHSASQPPSPPRLRGGRGPLPRVDAQGIVTDHPDHPPRMQTEASSAQARTGVSHPGSPELRSPELMPRRGPLEQDICDAGAEGAPQGSPTGSQSGLVPAPPLPAYPVSAQAGRGVTGMPTDYC